MNPLSRSAVPNPELTPVCRSLPKTVTCLVRCARSMNILAIGAGLIFGSYLDPTLSRLGLSDSVIDEVRMRDIPFWFSFMAAGALTAMYAGVGERSARGILLGVMLITYVVYAAVRIFSIGEQGLPEFEAQIHIARILLEFALQSRKVFRL